MVHVVFPAEHAVRLPIHGLQSIILGRDPEPEDPRRVGHDSVSRRHLELRWDDGQRCYVARDMGSRNGTWVDGEGLASGGVAALRRGVVRMGDVVAVVEFGQGLAPHSGSETTSRWPGRSAAAHRLRAAFVRLAGIREPVALEGELGTAKLFAAEDICRFGGGQASVVAVDCSTVDSVTLRHRLFGQGSERRGVLYGGAGTCLLIDAVEQLPNEHQQRLLEAIRQDDPNLSRVMVGTATALVEEVEAGRILPELAPLLLPNLVRLPALREQPADVLPWMDALAPGSSTMLDSESAEKLLLVPWRRNVEDIQRLLAEVAAGGKRRIRVSDLPTWIF